MNTTCWDVPFRASNDFILIFIQYLAVFSVAIVMCQAYGGGGYGGGASYGGGGYGGGGYGGGGYGVIPAAIQSRHHVEYYDGNLLIHERSL